MFLLLSSSVGNYWAGAKVGTKIWTYEFVTIYIKYYVNLHYVSYPWLKEADDNILGIQVTVVFSGVRESETSLPVVVVF